MTDPEDRILDRVRKLLNKAEDPACTTHEAEAFTAKATELIAKYGIDQALLSATGGQPAKIIDRKIRIEGTYSAAKASLCANIAMSLGCRAILTDQRKVVHVFGYEADVERAELLYTSLLVQSVNSMMLAERPYWEGLKAWRRSFLIGFTNEIIRRLRAAEQRAKDTAQQNQAPGGPSVALVLRDRSIEVAAAFTEAYPRVSYRSSSRPSAGGGYTAGTAAGRNANMGGTSIRGAGGRSLGS